MLNYEKFCKFWSKGGNWVFFFLFWFIASAVISSLEHSEENVELTEEEISKEAVNALTNFLKLKKDYFKNYTLLENQLEKIIDVMDTNPDMPRLWAEMDIEMILKWLYFNTIWSRLLSMW
jgi:hypothetical protein